jgi:hypothetical protein
MRTMTAFVASLVVALVVASALADRGAAQSVVTGTVGEYEAGSIPALQCASEVPCARTFSFAASPNLKASDF